MKKKHWMLTPWFIIFGVAMLLMTTFMSSYSLPLFYVDLVITVASFAVVLVLTLTFRNYIKRTVKGAAERIKDFNSDYLEKYKYPVAIAGEEGDIIWCNARFRKSLCNGRSPEGDDINAYLSGHNVFDILDGEGVDIAVDGKEFTAYCITTGDGSVIVCHFIENTYYKNMVREYNAGLPCVALVTFDNAEDFYADSDESFSTVMISLEANLQRWALEYNALYKRITNNRFMIIFRDADVDKMIGQKFPILKDVRSISSARLVATISVGLSRGCKTVKESELNARKALEMALGRGGDQVALIKDNSYEFFGGTAVATEKLSKVRMRVIANALTRAISDSDKVYIMGHRFSDLDCIGAAIGMQCVVEKSCKRYCKIVVDRLSSMSKQLIDYTDERLENNIFISPEEALKGVTSRSLLIVVDTHIKSSLESPALFDKCKRCVVIDHHRKSVRHIDSALVFCHEPSASSASEMCAEIISYMDDKPLGYVQADALLSGIMLDTKNFVLKTGVRTFEAAAYLRRKGANTLTVKEMFSGSIDTYREKVEIVCRSEMHRGCAISRTDLNADDIRLAAAQAADEMLTLTGVTASFVLFNSGNQINVSARSYGRVNVQLIMEKLGGGGHQTMAASQLSGKTKDEVYELLIKAIDETLDEAEDEEKENHS